MNFFRMSIFSLTFYKELLLNGSTFTLSLEFLNSLFKKKTYPYCLHPDKIISTALVLRKPIWVTAFPESFLSSIFQYGLLHCDYPRTYIFHYSICSLLHLDPMTSFFFDVPFCYNSSEVMSKKWCLGGQLSWSFISENVIIYNLSWYICLFENSGLKIIIPQNFVIIVLSSDSIWYW